MLLGSDGGWVFGVKQQATLTPGPKETKRVPNFFLTFFLPFPTIPKDNKTYICGGILETFRNQTNGLKLIETFLWLILARWVNILDVTLGWERRKFYITSLIITHLN